MGITDPPSRPSPRVGHVAGHPSSSASGQGPRWRHGLGAIEFKRKEVLFTSQMKTDRGDLSIE